MDEITTEDIVDLARDVGIEYSREYPGINCNDIAQEALAYFYKHVKTIEGRNKGWIRKALATAARKYCNKERTDYMYYTSQYLYTPRDIRLLLEVAYTTGYDSHSTPTKGDRDNVLDAGSVVVSVFDLLTAIEKLNEESKAILDKKFCGEDLTRAEVRKYYRVVDNIVILLNRHLNSRERIRQYEGPGNRKAISNARAQAITADHGYNERGEHTKDAVVDIQHEMRQMHPISVPSKHVVNSPWRKDKWPS